MTTVGNYGSTSGINVGQLRPPKLVSYGDAMAPLFNRFSKLEDIANKKKEIADARAYKAQEQENQNIFNRSMQDDRQVFQSGQTDKTIQAQKDAADADRVFKSEIFDKETNRQKDMISKREASQMRIAIKKAGLQLTNAKKINKLNSDSPVEFDPNKLTVTYGSNPEVQKAGIDPKIKEIQKYKEAGDKEGFKKATEELNDIYKSLRKNQPPITIDSKKTLENYNNKLIEVSNALAQNPKNKGLMIQRDLISKGIAGLSKSINAETNGLNEIQKDKDKEALQLIREDTVSAKKEINSLMSNGASYEDAYRQVVQVYDKARLKPPKKG